MLFLFLNFFQSIHDFLALVVSAFRANRVRRNHGSAMGAFYQSLGLELKLDSRPISSPLGVPLLLD